MFQVCINHFENKKLKEIVIKTYQFEVRLINYGASIISICIPDKNNILENVVLNLSSAEEYLKNRSFLGATVGPTAGRIENGYYESGENKYYFEKNEGENHLHGGFNGYDTLFWDFEIKEYQNSIKVDFNTKFQVPCQNSLISQKVSYTIFTNKKIIINYEGSSNDKTILNPTNHTYFNLSGNNQRLILDHNLTLRNSKVCFLNSEHIPQFPLIKDEIFDLSEGKKLNYLLKSKHPQIIQEGGLNHPFLLDGQSLLLEEKKSGRVLKMTSSSNYVVVYTGNHFDGETNKKHSGIALETQELYEKGKANLVTDTNNIIKQETVWEFKNQV